MSKQTKAMGLAVVVVAAALVGGTWAFFGDGQTVTNDVDGGSTPGVRLHDDYDAAAATTLKAGESVNKDVYVENWGTYAAYVRVKLSEYLERGYGEKDSDTQKTLVSIDGADKAETTTWRPHVVADADGTPAADAKGIDPFHAYYSLTMGGQKYYLPTDNHDDTGDADADKADNQVDYSGDKTAGVTGTPKTDLYQADDMGYDASSAPGKPHNGEGKGVAATPTATVVTMADWLTNKQVDVWVSDTDGWYYWVGSDGAETPKPIGLAPGAVTGLLLDQVTLNALPESDSWWYGIHVELQALTAEDQYAFIDKGMTDGAWTLLETIGGFSLLKPDAQAFLDATHPAVPASTTGTRTTSVPLVKDLDELFEDTTTTKPTYEIVADETTATATINIADDGTLTYAPTTEEAQRVIVVKATIGGATHKITLQVTASKVAQLTSAYTYTLNATTGRYEFTAEDGMTWIILDVGGDAAGDGSTADDAGIAYVYAKTPLADMRPMSSTEASMLWTYPNDLNVWLNGTYYNGLPDAFRNRLVATTLWTNNNADRTQWGQTSNYVWLPSEDEVFGSNKAFDGGTGNPPAGVDPSKGLYPSEDLFDFSVMKTQYSNSASSSDRYWLRNLRGGGAAVWYISGNPIGSDTYSTAHPVRPALRVNLNPTT